jgi:hypothetical protein
MYPRDAISALVCGYSREIRKRKTLIMLTAFVDDSASEDTDKLFVLAGYAQNAEVWASFSDDWQKKLDANPRIEYFKMREAQNLSGQFFGWDPIVRNRKVHAMADVIEEHEPWSIEAYMSKAQYQRIVAPIVPHDIRHPYLDLFYALIIKLAHWHYSLGLQIPVDFVFDEQGEIGEEAVMWYSHIKSLQPPEIQALMGSTPIFRDDKKVLPLQAADLLAWHLRRGREERNKNEYRPVMERLFPSMHASAELGDEYLQKIAREMSEVPGIDKVRGEKNSIKPILRHLLGGSEKKNDREK